jgi:hypothetical protein
MTRRSLAAALVACAVALAPGSAGAAPSGPLAQACAPAGSTAVALCYGGDVVTRDAQAYAQPGRFEAAIRAYERSWAHRALGLQYALADDVGFASAPWPGTHNSFNSIAEEGPSLSDTDANQQLTLTDQLRLDMRSLELDVHWFPSLRAGGAYAPVVCHAGAVSEHDGCTTERLLGPILDELAAWLHAHRDQVLLLYIEDHIDSGYPVAAATIKSELGSLVYPTGSTNGTCVKLPLTRTRDDVLASGAQVVIVSGCGSGSAWRSVAFDWSNHVEERPHDYQGPPKCGPDFSRATYDSTLVRYYEDSTWLTTGAAQLGQGSVDDGLTPATVRAMISCGVDLFGFDQLEPGDGRAEALVWSWAPGQPGARGGCAVAGSDGGWSSTSCRSRHRVACRDSDGSWFVPAHAKVPFNGAAKVCQDAGGEFSAPRTGYENALLADAASRVPLWLAYVKDGDEWAALDRR